MERGEITRLMIFVPPRHGKSELASRRFPAWYVGRNPEKQIIAASYGQDLATDFGRTVRNVIASQEFRVTFGAVELAPDSTAANRWHTSHGGSYVAAGVGSAITGRGADLLVIDDPVKNREDADSEVIRNHTWDWYRSTAYTRLMPGGAIVLIQTRWHDDDLAGRLLGNEGGDTWTVIDLPAVTDQGNALWPEWYDLEALTSIQNNIGPREWSALYQQQPVPDRGDFFQSDWIRYYTGDTPDVRYLNIYGASDYAVTDKGGDYTVHGVMGIDPDANIYLLDWWREQASSSVWVDAVLDMMVKWEPLYWAEETGQIISSIGPFLTLRMNEKNIVCQRRQYSSARDKATRARSIQARMSMGKVMLPRSAPWTTALAQELLRFPTGRHDDQVDVLSLFGRILDDVRPGRGPKPKQASRGRTLADIDREERQNRAGIRGVRQAYYA